MRRAAGRLLAALPALLGSTALAGEPFERQITFGDSLSDNGFYSSVAPPDAGAFTTNPDPMWVEVVGDTLGLDTRHVVNGGNNYAAGGARVIEPNGGPPPILTQIRTFTSGNDFRSEDLVTLQGTGNDFFALRDGLATPQEAGEAAIALARIADELAATDISTLLVANTQSLRELNAIFEAELARLSPNALFLDVAGLYREIRSDPAAFGILNTTDRACGDLPFAFLCNRDDLVEPDANLTYLSADGTHPAGRAQRIQGDAALALLNAPQQIGQLALVGEAEIDSALATGRRFLVDAQRNEARVAVVGVTATGLSTPDGQIRPGIDYDSLGFEIGSVRAVTPGLRLAALLSYRAGMGDFAGPIGGGFESELLLATVSASADLVRGFAATFAVTGGRIWLDDIERQFDLGPQNRTEAGGTQGRVFGLLGEVSRPVPFERVRISPFVGTTFKGVRLDAYSEETDRFSSLSYSRNEIERTRLYLGAEIAPSRKLRVEPVFRASHHFALGDDDREITFRSINAPIAFTTDAYSPSASYTDLEARLRTEISPRFSISLNVDGQVGRDDIERVGGSLWASLAF